MYFHLTYKYQGLKPTFLPRDPKSDISEPDTPRICFASTIKQALMGMHGGANFRTGFDFTKKCIFVYVIHGNSTVCPAHKVDDAYRTGEVWRLVPTQLKYYGKVTLVKDKLVIKRR
jgi:hypothetical protein